MTETEIGWRPESYGGVPVRMHAYERRKTQVCTLCDAHDGALPDPFRTVTGTCNCGHEHAFVACPRHRPTPSMHGLWLCPDCDPVHACPVRWETT